MEAAVHFLGTSGVFLVAKCSSLEVAYQLRLVLLEREDCASVTVEWDGGRLASPSPLSLSRDAARGSSCVA